MSDTPPDPAKAATAQEALKRVVTAPRPSPPPSRMAVLCAATVASVLLVIFIVQDLARQPVLVTSLASSTFLLYYQPLNEINRFKPLVLGHLVACAIGFAASRLLPTPYWSAGASLAAAVIVLIALRLIHPPAVSTGLVFSYQPREVEAVMVFLLTLAVVAALALIYFVLHRYVHPTRWARHFGLLEER